MIWTFVCGFFCASCLVLCYVFSGVLCRGLASQLQLIIRIIRATSNTPVFSLLAARLFPLIYMVYGYPAIVLLFVTFCSCVIFGLRLDSNFVWFCHVPCQSLCKLKLQLHSSTLNCASTLASASPLWAQAATVHYQSNLNKFMLTLSLSWCPLLGRPLMVLFAYGMCISLRLCLD